MTADETVILCPYCQGIIAEDEPLCPTCYQNVTDDAPIETTRAELERWERVPCRFCAAPLLTLTIYCPACRRWQRGDDA